MIQLGSFIFNIDDYPEELPLGGSSLVSIHKFSGGRKSIQNFGAFDDAIMLTGTFRYQGALTKVRSIDQMWRAGQPVQFIVDSLSPRYVLITAFKIKYKNDYEIDYTITMERVDSTDLNAIIYGDQTASSGASTTTASTSAAPQQTYTVQAGDTLWGIAAKSQIYGDGSKYTKIVAANDIKDPSTIQTGQQLVIPT